MLSVIIPVYNAAVFLPRCLESLIGQTYQNLEVICVDDGSSDNSLEILQQYADRDSRIKVIHQENAGVSAARNAGLDVATGEYVTFVDADDWLELDAYEKIVSHMREGVDLVCFGTIVEGDSKEEEMADKERYYGLKYKGCVNCGTKEIMGTDAGVWNKLYRRTVMEHWGIRFPFGLAYGEDACFFVMYASVCRETYFLHERLYHYWVHPASAMARAKKKNVRCIDHLKAVEVMNNFWSDKELAGNRRKLLETAMVQWYNFAQDFTPDEMDVEVDELAYRMARSMGFLRKKEYETIRRLRKLHQRRFERFFHWYVANRECYGLIGLSIYSITYEADRNVHRLMGRVLKTVKQDDLA